MGLITKIDNLEEFKSRLTDAEITKMIALEKELAPSNELVMLGSD